MVTTGVGLGLAGVSLLVPAGGLSPRVARTPEDEPAHPGDLLVLAKASGQSQHLTVSGVPEGGPAVFAWPMDPATRTVRSGAPTNLVLLVRAGASGWFSEEARAHAVEGVIAYSATCTHLCCDVSSWATPSGAPRGVLLCPCHRSVFDPWSAARVVSGPAPRPLPILPIRVEGGQLVVAGAFLSTPGCAG